MGNRARAVRDAIAITHTPGSIWGYMIARLAHMGSDLASLPAVDCGSRTNVPSERTQPRDICAIEIGLFGHCPHQRVPPEEVLE